MSRLLNKHLYSLEGIGCVYVELVVMGSRVAALRDAYDQVSEDREAVESARASFENLLQVASVSFRVLLDISCLILRDTQLVAAATASLRLLFVAFLYWNYAGILTPG